MRRAGVVVLGLTLALLLAGCGGGSSSKSSTGSGSGSSTVANTTTLSVNGGPSTVTSYTNGIFVTVTVCKPGTTSCVDVPNVLLDTGSTGLRLLSSAVSGVGLANVTSNGRTLSNCVQYLDGSYNWGAVATADVKMSGEVASSVPIQIIASPTDNFPAAPSACGGTADNTVNTLLANGILGVSFFLQDCGSACESSSSNPGDYYSCTSSSCVVTTVPLAQQLQNPVAMFSSDNNGLMLTLPSVPTAGAVSVSGTLTFGIGTQSDNAIGSATVLTADNYGNLSTTFNGNSTDIAFLDSGSSALYFFNSELSGIPVCAQNTDWYCPSSLLSLSAEVKGSNSKSSNVSFQVASADTLASTGNVAFSDLAGTGTDAKYGPYFDWGLPFFFGRSVYVAFEGSSAGGATGPFWAF